MIEFVKIGVNIIAESVKVPYRIVTGELSVIECVREPLSLPVHVVARAAIPDDLRITF